MKKFFKNLFIISLVLISSILIFKNFKDNKNSSESSDNLDSSSVSILEIIPEGYIKPEGTLDISANGEYDIKDYESVNVNVSPETTIEDTLITGNLTHYYNDRVINIGERVFYQYNNLESINFPNVEIVGGYAFYGCSRLTYVNLPNAIIIGNMSFNGTNVVSINLPKCTTINDQAFRYCSNLSEIYLGSIEQINGAVFAQCTGITKLIITNENQVCKLGSTNTFNGSSIANGSGFIYVPDLLYESYLSNTQWSVYSSQIKPLSELNMEELYYE